MSTTTMETTVRERPILFSAAMVRAILEGRKTVTRRIVKPQPPGDWPSRIECRSYFPIVIEDGEQVPGPEVYGFADEGSGRVSPYGRPWDRLWVRETWRETFDPYNNRVIDYRAGGSRLTDGKSVYHGEHATLSILPRWKPSIHMFRWASRITLEVTGVRVERLQSISEADAIAEGCQSHYCSPEDTASCPPGSDARALAEVLEGGFLTAKFDYEQLWNEINGDGSWKLNPFVWVVSFKRITP